MSNQHILIVDDDPQVRRMLRRCFEGEGYDVTEAATGDRIETAVNKADLVTLDLNLGREDGLEVARRVRQVSDVPIIMITGKGDMIDRIVGLEVGADDYIPKPFHLREVLARVRSVLRRSGSGKPNSFEDSTAIPIRFDGFELDPARRSLRAPGGEELPLTTGEFDLLVVFANHPHAVLDRDRIMDLMKGHDWAPNDRSIDNQVARLRKLIESDTRHPRLIRTVRGAGYSFTPSRLER
ncbi:MULTISPECIES: response regulator [Devosia]|uniref:response regulator n=1 Tax=Devosia TaxID=46913 RepID=UPI000CE9453D|nr:MULTISPECIES: response regulator [Devosia]AVF02328.1 DNA-binding response regulator [Devosia sp. I507]